MAGNGHGADTRAKPPLKVVAPILAVDSGASCSGCALEDDFENALEDDFAERAARAVNRATGTALHGCHYFQ
jgi:hypothetical protein